MRQLRDDTHLILDGEVRVYRRERSKRWQAAFVIDGHTVRVRRHIKWDIRAALTLEALVLLCD